ncbi:MAG: hypothetical protein JWR26_2539 [Pedosphaera sp.]|nr:hypothetical protein [Pedosphaera sp.]
MKIQWIKFLFWLSAIWAFIVVVIGNTTLIKPIQPSPFAAKEFDHFWLEYALCNLPFFLLIVTGLLSLRSMMHSRALSRAEGLTGTEKHLLSPGDKRILWIALAAASWAVAFLIYSTFFGLVSKEML